MDFFYDVDTFIESLSPMVQIVRALPPALEAFARDEPDQAPASRLPRPHAHSHTHSRPGVLCVLESFAFRVTVLAHDA